MNNVCRHVTTHNVHIYYSPINTLEPPLPCPNVQNAPACSERVARWSPQLHHAEQDKQRWRMDKAQLEQTLQENKERMEKLEGYWMEAQSLCQAVDEHLKETQAQYQALERKYSKAKRLIKEYQQK